MRSRSAMTQGRSRARSRSMSCLPPPLRKPLHASPARRATSVGSGETARVPVSMRATSSRSADQHVHPVDLRVDDPEELPHLGGVKRGWRGQQGRDGAFDRGQRGAQLVAHHREKLGPQPLQLLQRRYVLHCSDDGGHLTVVGADGRGGDQYGHRPAIGNGQRYLLGPQRLPRPQRLGEGKLPQGDLPPVGPLDGQHFQELLRRIVRRLSGLP